MPIKLNRTQKASSNLSQEWKRQSKLLLDTEDISEFRDAVVWCGKGGNVLRTLEKKFVQEFSEFLFNNKNEINNGNFKLSSLQNFGKKRPLSWASKIIHIMNPKKYPIIYDGNIRKVLGIKTIKQYEKRLIEERKLSKKMNDNDLYKYDSDIWASQSK